MAAAGCLCIVSFEWITRTIWIKDLWRYLLFRALLEHRAPFPVIILKFQPTPTPLPPCLVDIRWSNAANRPCTVKSARYILLYNTKPLVIPITVLWTITHNHLAAQVPNGGEYIIQTTPLSTELCCKGKRAARARLTRPREFIFIIRSVRTPYTV